jgi:hypothetical protein
MFELHHEQLYMEVSLLTLWKCSFNIQAEVLVVISNDSNVIETKQEARL